jgi:hypothetical protein
VPRGQRPLNLGGRPATWGAWRGWVTPLAGTGTGTGIGTSISTGTDTDTSTSTSTSTGTSIGTSTGTSVREAREPKRHGARRPARLCSNDCTRLIPILCTRIACRGGRTLVRRRAARPTQRALDNRFEGSLGASRAELCSSTW